MGPEFERLIEPNRLYRPKELGGKAGERGLLGIGYDTVIRDMVGPIEEPKPGIIARWNKKRTRRTGILIPGWVVMKWIEENLQ